MTWWWTVPLVQRALIGGVLIGVLTAWVGTFVVLRRMAFMGAGVGHAAFGGVALGLLLGWDPIWTAAGFCMLVAWGITLVTRRGHLPTDTAIGVFFTATMALGLLLLGQLSNTTDVFGLLFGSLLAIDAGTLVQLAVFTSLGVGALVLFHRGFVLLAFDPEHARALGWPEAWLDYLFAALVALTVVAAIRVVGLILASALLVVPAAAALYWSRSFRQLIALAVAFGVASVVLGLALALWWDLPPGATIVLTAAAGFTLAWLTQPTP